MYRQHQYKPGITAQIGNLREGHVNAPPQVEGAGAGILKAAMALGGEVMNVVAKDYAREMRGRMDDSILRVNAEFEKWKTEYKRTRQGVDALSAQQDFADKYMELANQAVADFGGNGNEIYAGELQRLLVKDGFYAIKAGGEYQLQQDEAWQKSQWDAQLSSFQKIVDDNPNDPDMLNMEAQTLLQSWIAKNPGKDPGAIRDQIQSMQANGRLQSLIAGKDYEGAKRLLHGGFGGQKIGLALASEESGADKMLAIGHDPNGGTSYGTWQLSSKQGSMGEWLDLLAAKGEKEARIAREIRAAGPLNSGSRKGAVVDVYKKHARENAELFEETQREYLLKSHYGPALASLPEKQRAMIESNPALREMLFSTAVQHGGGGAARIFKNAWQEGMAETDLVNAVYAGRAKPGNFKSTPDGMAQNITQGRFPRERDKVLAMLNGGRQAGPSIPGLTAAQRMHYQAQIDAAEKRDAAELRAGLDLRLADYFAAAEEGKGGAFTIDPAQVVAAYGDKADKILARINEAAKLSDAVQRIQATDAEGMNKLIKELAPETPGEGYAAQRQTREKYRQIAQAHLQERAKNPTGYLMNANPGLQTAYNAMLQNPSPETASAYLQGLAAASDVLKMGAVPIFPQGQAQALSNAIMAAPDPGAMLQTLQDAFGPHWGRAFQELSAKDCLPVSAQVVGNGMNRTDAKLLMEGIKDKDFQTKFYDLHKDASFSKKDFDEQVLGEMEEFNATILGGGDQTAAVELNRAVATLAMQYINTQGLKYKDAIEKAAKNVILDRYSIQKINGGSFRVPSVFNGDLIEDGAGAVMRLIADKPEELAAAQYAHLGEHAAPMYGNLIKRAGRWVTNGDESGLALFVGTNAVLDKNGRPVMRTWAELQKAGKNQKEQIAEQDVDIAMAAGLEE